LFHVASIAPATRRVLLRTVAALAIAAAIALVLFLPFAGRALADEDPLADGDAIVVLAGARVERWLEAVDLYRERRAPLIVLSPGRLDEAEARLAAMGIRYPREGELARDAMLQMGIPSDAIVILPGSVDNTAAEAAAVRTHVGARGWQRVIVVTSKYHARRAGFAFRREFARTPVQVIIRASRHDPSDPARWWRRRPEVRYVSSELQKLAAYILGLGD
jgi:uncharacterized SAM-binding protein YcdF (DUF218 family)